MIFFFSLSCCISWHKTRGRSSRPFHVAIAPHVGQHISYKRRCDLSSYGSPTGGRCLSFWNALTYPTSGCKPSSCRIHGPTAHEHIGQHSLSTQSGGFVWGLGCPTVAPAPGYAFTFAASQPALAAVHSFRQWQAPIKFPQQHSPAP